MFRGVVRWLSCLNQGRGDVGRRRPVDRPLQCEPLEPRVLLSAKLAPGPDLRLPGHPSAAPPPDDKYEENDTFAKAKNLGTLSAPAVFADLVLNDDDWFKFTTQRAGDLNDFVSIGFIHEQGDIDMELYDSKGVKLAESRGASNSELISLNGYQKGVYYLKVFGWRGSVNPSYDLSIAPPTAADQKHSMYVNFDGAFLSRANLDRWDNGEWLAGSVAGWDAGNDGITVSPFLNGRADRESVIASVMSNLQSDLKAFGIQVVRHFGLAWENVGATTLFVGAHVLDNGQNHVACEVDVQNVNGTDIAFVGDESGVWTKNKDLILATSDIALHEAGHTFGLAHVSSGKDTESMGLRYSTTQDQWNKDTSFRNKYYTRLEAGDGSLQNSYRYMQSIFVSGSANLAAASPAHGVHDLDCHFNPETETAQVADLVAFPTQSASLPLFEMHPSLQPFDSVHLGPQSDLHGVSDWVGSLWDNSTTARRRANWN